ncbi:MAG: site-specific integrase [Sporocytophaga sp.]|uniref:site-specific integrase n=1 Tax=Sporocytophaga sp. TaxID=2231183 RepID=UPI001B164730|nr:site-specific integrase [Sporocytophaga sp.]MBO9699269.1 site-specific integrase [Sporocytophaga sp.]
MATLRTIIRRREGKPLVNEHGETIIYIQYGHHAKTTLISTGVKINPEYWNEKKQIVDSKRGIKNTRANEDLLMDLGRTDTFTNALLKSLRAKVEGIVRKIQYEEKDPTIHVVKEEFEKQYRQERIVEKDFFTHYDEYLGVTKNLKALSTYKHYKTLRGHLKDYSEMHRFKITLENIDHKFYENFIQFMYKDIQRKDGSGKLVKRAGLQNNSVGNLIKNLKTFLGYMETMGFKVNDSYKKFKANKEKGTVIYLTQEELEILCNMDLSNCERLDRVRDLFVFQCSTGLRYSDIKRVGSEHISDNVIRLKAHKTKKDIQVPLTPRSLAILDKYNYELPVISEQLQNQYLKELCSDAGLTSKVEVPFYQGGKKEYKKYFKFELVTTHVAVKTFITHCAERGISPKVAAEITGKTVKVLLDHYYGTTNKVIEMEMQRAFGAVESQLKAV